MIGGLTQPVAMAGSDDLFVGCRSFPAFYLAVNGYPCWHADSAWCRAGRSAKIERVANRSESDALAVSITLRAFVRGRLTTIIWYECGLAADGIGRRVLVPIDGKTPNEDVERKHGPEILTQRV
jgi:hypothetical protein